MDRSPSGGRTIPSSATRALPWALVGLLLLAQPLCADQLTLESRSGGFRVADDASQILVGFQNESERQGLQFDLVYDPALLRPVKVSGVGRLDGTPHLYSSVSPPGLLHVLVFDRRGQWSVPAGSDPVVAVTFDVLDAPSSGTLRLAAVHGIGATSTGASISLAPVGIDVAMARGPQTTDNPPPTRFALHQNIPNPFTGETLVRFDIPHASKTRIVVYDLAGRSVRVLANGRFPPGRHSVTWGDGAADGHARPGIYFLAMEAEHFRAVKKMIRLE